MTIQPVETGTSLDLELMVGAMEAIPCDSLGHAMESERDAHAGPATHYARTDCPNCGPGPIKAYCAPMVAFCRDADHGIICAECGYISSAASNVTILGPVNSFG